MVGADRVALQSADKVFGVMPALAAGIHVFLRRSGKQDVDGLDEPGHDEIGDRSRHKPGHDDVMMDGWTKPGIKIGR